MHIRPDAYCEKSPELIKRHCLLADTAKVDAAWMRSVLQHNIDVLGFSKQQQDVFWSHMHFAVTSVMETGHWLDSLLAEWTSPRRVLTITNQAGLATSYFVLHTRKVEMLEELRQCNSS